MVACRLFGHYLTPSLVVVNWTLRNQIQWNFDQNTRIVIHENASENIVGEMAAILPRGDKLEIKENIFKHTLVVHGICSTSCLKIMHCGEEFYSRHLPLFMSLYNAMLFIWYFTSLFYSEITFLYHCFAIFHWRSLESFLLHENIRLSNTRCISICIRFIFQPMPFKTPCNWHHAIDNKISLQRNT